MKIIIKDFDILGNRMDKLQSNGVILAVVMKAESFKLANDSLGISRPMVSAMLI